MPHSTKEKNNLRQRQWRRNRYDTVISYLGGKCVKCQSEQNLEIDHINPKDKSFSISLAIGHNDDCLMDEIDKCQLLCYECHISKTIIERGKLPARCGSTTMYSKGCRCDLCKQAKAKYSTEYYNRNH